MSIVAGLLRVSLGSYESSTVRREATGRLWPNGEFSLGFRNVGEASTEGEEWRWTGGDEGLSPNELDERLECLHGWLDCFGRVYSVSGRLAFQHLTLSSVFNSHRPSRPSKNGLKGLTGMGGKMLRSGAFLLEDRLGTSDCCFTTLTVPALSQDERVVVARSWGKLTNRLVQYLSRRLEEAQRPKALCGCAEVQSARLEKTGEAYLHLHVLHPAFSNAPGRRWAVDVSALKTWWKTAIERVIGRELESAPRVEMAQVEKSVERYLSKYISKGDGDALAEFIRDLGEESVPGQWWFMSAPLRHGVKEGTACGRNAGALLEAMVYHLLEEGTGEGFEYIRHVDLRLDDRLVTVGYVGKFDRSTTAELMTMLDRQ